MAKTFIREWRQLRDWSRAELAEALGKPVSFVGRLERGEERVSEAMLAKIAKALRLSPDDLLTDPSAVDAERVFRIYQNLLPPE